MKKITFKTLLATLFALSCLFASAQEKNLILGVKGGINLADFQDSKNTKSKIGIVAGVTVDYNIMGDLFILSGLEYVGKGSETDGGEGNGDGIDLNYLQLPVHLGYKYALTPDIKLVGDIGPYLAYGISGKIKYKAIGDYEAYEIDAFGDDAYKSFDLGLGLGVGVEVSQVNLRIGYDYGLSKINEFQSIVEIENSCITLTAGYKF
jgi:hypothetical protein